jgi:hypothetical protein
VVKKLIQYKRNWLAEWKTLQILRITPELSTSRPGRLLDYWTGKIVRPKQVMCWPKFRVTGWCKSSRLSSLDPWHGACDRVCYSGATFTAETRDLCIWITWITSTNMKIKTILLATSSLCSSLLSQIRNEFTQTSDPWELWSMKAWQRTSDSVWRSPLGIQFMNEVDKRVCHAS